MWRKRNEEERIIMAVSVTINARSPINAGGFKAVLQINVGGI